MARSLISDLAGEDGEGGGGFAVGGAEEEATEDDAILHIDPEKAAAAEVRAALAGDEDVAVIADLHGDAGAGKDFVEGVSEGHVASVMEHAVGDVGVDDVVELAVVVEVAGRRAVELGEEGEGGSGDGIEEQRFCRRAAEAGAGRAAEAAVWAAGRREVGVALPARAGRRRRGWSARRRARG